MTSIQMISPPAATPSLTPAQLQSLAAHMLERVNGPGQYARTKLATGLDVIVQRMDALRWRLALAREGQFPSAEEVDAWRGLVAVPPGAAARWLYKTYRHPKSNRTILYYVTELTWLEYNQEAA